MSRAVNSSCSLHHVPMRSRDDSRQQTHRPARRGGALVAAAFVFARRFRRIGRRGWAAASYAIAAAYLVSTIVGIVIPDYRAMLAGGALSWLWVSAVTAHVLAGRPFVRR